jgi:hypothetical protein
MMPIITLIGSSVAMLELTCYICFYHHIYNHDNTVAINIVTPAVIKMRNQVTNLNDVQASRDCTVLEHSPHLHKVNICGEIGWFFQM